MYPIQQLHPQAYDKSKTIICEKDGKKAMKLLEDVYAKRQIPPPACETDVVDKNIMLAKKLDVRGTPTMFFTDGSRTSGALAKEALIQLIDARSKP